MHRKVFKIATLTVLKTLGMYRFFVVAVVGIAALHGHTASAQDLEKDRGRARQILESLIAAEDTANELEVYEKFVDQLGSELGAENPVTIDVPMDIAEDWYYQGRFREASALWKETARISRQVHGLNHPKTLMLMNNLASSLQAGGDLDGARKMKEQVLAIRLKVLGPEHPDTLTSMNNLAHAMTAQGDLDEARMLQEKVVAISRRVLGLEHPDTLNAMNNLAEMLHDQGDLDGAREMHEEVLEICIRVLGPEHTCTMNSMNNLALTQHDQGDLDGARRKHEEVLEIRRRVLGPEHPSTLDSMNNLGLTLQHQGDLNEARRLHEEVLEICRRVLGNEHPATLSTMNNFASVLQDKGDFDRARMIQEEVLGIRRRVLGNEHPKTMTSMNNLATVLQDQGDLEGARIMLEELLAISHRVLGEDHPNTLSSMNNLATIRRDQGDYMGARKLHEKVLKIRRRVLGPEHPDTIISMHNLATTLQGLGDLNAARKLQEKVLKIRRRVLGSGHPDTLIAQSNLAAGFLAAGELKKALHMFEEVVALRREKSDDEYRPATIIEADDLGRLGRIYGLQGNLDKAIGFYLQALDALDAQAVTFGDSEESRGRFRAEQDRYYSEAVEALFELGRPGDALATVERSRGQGLLRMLAERDLGSSDIPKELLRERNRIAYRYDRVFHELDSLDPSADRYQQLRSEQKTLRREREVVNDKIRRAAPHWARVRLPQKPSLEEIREALDPGTLLLTYHVGTERTLLFALTDADDLQVFELPVPERALWGKVDRFRCQLDGVTLSAARATMSSSLFETLLAPVADRIADSKRLLIVPDGPLHYLPFGALTRKNGETGRGWQYLLEWKPIHIALSVTTFAELRKPYQDHTESSPKRPQLAAFGDPDFPVKSAENDPNRALLRTAAIRGIFDDLIRLEHSRREVKEISKLFAPGSTEIFLGKEATEERAKAIGRKPRILHLATHAYADPASPLDSFLALAIPETQKEGADNGLLQVWEIYDQVRIDADLVVLSACQAGIGPELKGEGLMSLSRAFQYAGARTVAATLWSVADRSTAELMIRFYRHLHAGKSKDVALRDAQLELLAGPIEVIDEMTGKTVEVDYTSPYHWAAFQLIGDWQ